MKRNRRISRLVVLATLGFLGPARIEAAPESSASSAGVNQVLEWNQIFIDTLIATNTANSSSQRLGAIVHTAIFDAYNGIDRRYTPLVVHSTAPRGASRRAAVIAAAYTALLGLFPSQQPALDARYEASLGALSDECEHGGRSLGRRRACATRIERGIAWGTEVAHGVLAWRANDGFSSSYPSFAGGTAVGQWRPVPPATAMRAEGLAFTDPFVLVSNTQFQPEPLAVSAAARTRRISTPSGHWVQGLDPYVLTIRQRSHRSGRGTPAFTGIRQPTRLRAPTICRWPAAIGCSLF
jgi:hypothetical protein